jgi:type IV pilus assembly protein PilB
MTEKKKLGDVLKDAGLIDESQLQAALTHQRNWGGKIGAILVELGFVKETDLAKVISETLRIPYVNLFEPEVPEGIVKLIKPDIAKKYNIMPAKKEGGSLWVAMADPMDIKSLDEIRFVTGLTIKPALAMASEISDAIRKYYDHETVVHKDSSELLEKIKSSFKDKDMEIIRESGDMKSGLEWKPPAQPAQAASQEQAPVTDKLRLDALISLLIEKGLITRDEFGKIIEQKKLGL